MARKVDDRIAKFEENGSRVTRFSVVSRLSPSQ